MSSRQSMSPLVHLDPAKIPAHVAIIMDGNGRWAKTRRLPRIFGHRNGITSVREAVKVCAELGVKVLTLYAFSAENWSRPTTEVRALMSLLQDYIVRELPELQKNKVRLRAIGRLKALPEGAQKRLAEAKHDLEEGKKLSVTLSDITHV